MRVIALENEPSSLLGGQELNLFEICSYLAKRGHQISLIYTKEGNLVERYKEFAESIIQVKRYSAQRKNVIDLLKFAATLPGEISKVSAEQDSVVFCNEFSSVLWGHLLASYRGIPLVEYIQLPAYKFKFNWRPGLSGVSRFIAVSNHTKSSWVDLGIPEDKISVVYNGANTKKFAPPEDYRLVREKLGLPQDANITLFVGRLNPSKGVEVLIKAFALAFQSQPNTRLLIAGTPTLEPSQDSPEARIRYHESLKQLIRTLKIENAVQFLGHLSDTASLHQASDVTVVPSVWAEPFPRVALEALACGTPVLASRIGGLPELLSPQFENWLFEPGNERELADLLLQVRDWRQTHPDTSRQCRQHILDHFSQQQWLEGIEQVLLDTVYGSMNQVKYSSAL